MVSLDGIILLLLFIFTQDSYLKPEFPKDVSSNPHGILKDGDLCGVVWLSRVNSVAQIGALNAIRTSITEPSLIAVQ